jgi:glycosyltransferase involved in cell wall biosynthesis
VKILHVSSARTLGGGERHLADLAAGLAARGHEVYAALAPSSPLRELLAQLPRRNIISLPLRNALDVASAARLARFVRDNQIEIVHAHVARDYPLAAFAARLAPVARFVFTRHVLFPLSRVHALALSNVSRVVAVSEAVAAEIRARKIFPEHKIRVIPNGIDVEKFERAALSLDRESFRRSLGVSASFLVGIVGELSEVKGQEDFVRAAALLANERRGEVRFLVVGEDASRAGRNRAGLEKLVNELGMKESVRLLGHRDDAAQILSSLDVLVSASCSEAFGLAMIEAMACGVPVVATATEGAREIIEDGETGMLVPVGDVPALASAVNELLGDAQLRNSLSARARRMVRERFSLKQSIESTERLYREVLEEKH